MASPLQPAVAAWVEKTFGSEAMAPDKRWDKLWEEWAELTWTWEVEPSKTEELKAELADVYICLLALAESLSLDLEKIAAEKFKALGNQVYEFDPERGWLKVGS